MTEKEKIIKAIKDTRHKINMQLYKDDIKPAIEELFIFCNHYSQDQFIGDIIIQSASIRRLEAANRRGVINWDQVNIQKNKIILNILRIMDILNEDILNEETSLLDQIEMEAASGNIAIIPVNNEGLMSRLGGSKVNLGKISTSLDKDGNLFLELEIVAEEAIEVEAEAPAEAEIVAEEAIEVEAEAPTEAEIVAEEAIEVEAEAPTKIRDIFSNLEVLIQIN